MADIIFEKITPNIDGEGDSGKTAREKIERNFDKLKGFNDAVKNLTILNKQSCRNNIDISVIKEKIKLIKTLEETGLFAIDSDGNVGFKIVNGLIDALGLGDNLLNVVLGLIRDNTDLTPAINLIDRLGMLVQSIIDKTSLLHIVANKDGFCLVDQDGNIGWQFLPIVTGNDGVCFADKRGNIGLVIKDGVFDFSGFGKVTIAMLEGKLGSKKIKEAINHSDDNYEDVSRLKAEIEESVKSLATMLDANVSPEDMAEITVTVPPSTTNTAVSHGMVRLGLHYGAKPDFVSHDVKNNNLAVWDDVYLNGKCRKDFSDIRVFDGNGNMLPIYMVHHGNYEVMQDNNFRYQTVLSDSAGNLYNQDKRSTDNGRTWTQFFNKHNAKIYLIDEEAGDGYLYLFCEEDNSTYVESKAGDIVRIPMSNYELDTSNAEVVCHTWYYNYYYHAAITITGTAEENGILVLQATPSDGNVKRYEINVEEGMTGADICAIIANLNIKKWSANYSSGNTITLDSDECLIHINPDIEGSVDGLSVSVSVTKDGAQAFYPRVMRRHYCLYWRDGHKYLLISPYQEPYNVWVQRSIDDGPFEIVLNNQMKYEITGRNAQHIHHIHFDSYHNIIYVGMDDSNNAEFGPSVVKSYDNGETWVNVEFTDEEEETNPNALIWQNDRSRDFTPCWFSEDGTFSLGGGETNVLGGFTLLRTDNTEAVLAGTPSLTDKKFDVVIDNGSAIRAAIASLDDDFIVVPIVAGGTRTTAQLALSTDKGKTWRTIWHHEDPLSTRHVGNGPRYSCICEPSGDERQIIVTGSSEDDKYSPLRVYRGGNHYYGELLVDVGNLPANGMQLVVKSGYAMKYPNKLPFNREVLVRPVYSIKFDEGIGDSITDSRGITAQIVGDYEWKVENMPYGNLVPKILNYKRGYGLHLDLGSYINFGKVRQLNFSRGFTIVAIMNFNFCGNVTRDEDYYGFCPIVTFGNCGVYAYAAGFALGTPTAYSYCWKSPQSSSLVGIPNIIAIKVSASDNIDGTDRPEIRVKCGDSAFTKFSPSKGGTGNFQAVNISENDLVIGSPNTEKGYKNIYNHDRITLSEIRFYDKELSDAEVDSIVFGYTRRFEKNITN